MIQTKMKIDQATDMFNRLLSDHYGRWNVFTGHWQEKWPTQWAIYRPGYTYALVVPNCIKNGGDSNINPEQEWRNKTEIDPSTKMGCSAIQEGVFDSLAT